MADFTLNIDLLKLSGATRQEVVINGQKIFAVVIPVDRGMLYNGQKGVYLDLRMVNKPNSFGSSHFLRQSVSKGVYDKLTLEERSTLPILGNAKEVKAYSRPEPRGDEMQYGNFDDI